jgi:hypothetical protein
MKETPVIEIYKCPAPSITPIIRQTPDVSKPSPVTAVNDKGLLILESFDHSRREVAPKIIIDFELDQGNLVRR